MESVVRTPPPVRQSASPAVAEVVPESASPTVQEEAPQTIPDEDAMDIASHHPSVLHDALVEEYVRDTLGKLDDAALKRLLEEVKTTKKDDLSLYCAAVVDEAGLDPADWVFGADDVFEDLVGFIVWVKVRDGLRSGSAPAHMEAFAAEEPKEAAKPSPPAPAPVVKVPAPVPKSGNPNCPWNSVVDVPPVPQSLAAASDVSAKASMPSLSAPVPPAPVAKPQPPAPLAPVRPKAEEQKPLDPVPAPEPSAALENVVPEVVIPQPDVKAAPKPPMPAVAAVENVVPKAVVPEVVIPKPEVKAAPKPPMPEPPAVPKAGVTVVPEVVISKPEVKAAPQPPAPMLPPAVPPAKLSGEVTRVAEGVKKEQKEQLPNSVTHRKEWMQYCRQAKNPAKMQKSLLPMYQTQDGKLDLFRLWLDRGQSFLECELEVKRKQVQENAAKSVESALSRAQLLADGRYKEEDVDDLIRRQTEAGNYFNDPNFPNRVDLRRYILNTELTRTKTDLRSNETSLSSRARLETHEAMAMAEDGADFSHASTAAPSFATLLGALPSPSAPTETGNNDVQPNEKGKKPRRKKGETPAAPPGGNPGGNPDPPPVVPLTPLQKANTTKKHVLPGAFVYFTFLFWFSCNRTFHADASYNIYCRRFALLSSPAGSSRARRHGR